MPAGQNEMLSKSARTLPPRASRIPLQIFGPLLAVIIVVFLIAPRGSPLLLCLMAVPAILLIDRSWLQALRPDPLSLTLLGFGGYLLINSAWAASPAIAYSKVLLYGTLLILTYAAMAWIRQASPETRARMAIGMLLGFALGGIFLFIEILSHQSIQRAIFNYLPALRPAGKNLTIHNDVVVAIRYDWLNRNIAALNIVLWPALLLMTTRLNRKIAIPLCIVVTVAVAITTLGSFHESSKVAIVLALLAWTMSRLAPAWARRMVAGAWILTTIFIVPLVLLLFQQDMHHSRWLPKTAKQRVILWRVTAGKTLDAPILGAGIRTTKVNLMAIKKKPVLQQGYVYPWRTGRHGHNVYLQTWYELGAVGAAFLLAIGLLILRAMGKLPRPAQAFALAAFSTAAAIAAFSWGMWQAWFLSSFCLLAVLMFLAVKVASDDHWRDRENCASDEPVAGPAGPSAGPSAERANQRAAASAGRE